MQAKPQVRRNSGLQMLTTRASWKRRRTSWTADSRDGGIFYTDTGRRKISLSGDVHMVVLGGCERLKIKNELFSTFIWEGRQSCFMVILASEPIPLRENRSSIRVQTLDGPGNIQELDGP